MTQAISATLNARHAIADHVEFQEGPGGLTVAAVANAQARAVIALQGAQLLNWAPHGTPPVVWESPAAKYSASKSVRGGVPVCWPWFGPHATEPAFPAHGFARTLAWDVIATEALSSGATRLVFRFVPPANTRAWWPHASQLELHLSIGTVLEMDLVTRNLSDSDITITEALHTYFGVSDVRAISVLGLDGTDYLDKVGGGRQQQHGAITFSGETDRVYLATTAECIIDDPGLQRRIIIAKRGSRSTVVWNPWIDKAAKLGDLGDDGYLRMVCVESANGADDAVVVATGGEHRLGVRYTVEAR